MKKYTRQTDLSFDDLKTILETDNTTPCPVTEKVDSPFPTGVIVNEIGYIFANDEKSKGKEAGLLLLSLLSSDYPMRQLIATGYLKQHSDLLPEADQKRLTTFWNGMSDEWQVDVNNMITRSRSRQ